MKNITIESRFALAIALFACFFAVQSACSRNDNAAEPERQEKTAPTATNQGTGNVSISKNAQKKSGIETAAALTVYHQRELRAYGTVIDLQDFFAVRGKVAQAAAELKKAEADLSASSKAYDRMKDLYHNGQDVSAKALQEAEASWRSDKASVGGARSLLESLKVQTEQQWGQTLAGWLMTDTPDFEELRRGETILIQVTLPADTHVSSSPLTVTVQGATKTFADAHFVSLSPRSDPRIQGQTFFYKARSRAAGLQPGMSIVVFLPEGPAVPGVVIPASAIVWREGKSWVYLQQAPNRFERRAVTLDTRVRGGWFVTKEVQQGNLVVITGAQALLSKEFLPSKPKEEDEDED